VKNLPTGTVTFLFTDIEGSTTLLQRLGDRRYADVLEEHRRLLRAAFEGAHGQEISKHGDAFLVAFTSARGAVTAAVAAQRSLVEHPWPDGASLRVRMGLHTGEAVSQAGDYAGLDVHRASRICSAGHGGQILVSQAVGVLAATDLTPGVSLRDLGTHRLKDLQEPERLFQVVHPDLPADFPPLKTLDARRNNLPIQLTSFVGREREIVEVKRLLGDARLVTLTGSGGAGKTRLALQVSANLLDDYPDGVWLAEFAPIADPVLVPKTVATALGVPEQPGREIIETLVDALRSKTLLLALDNCEHLLAACADLAVALLRACPRVRILATSREGLRVPGETLWRVPSLSFPDVRHLPPSEDLVLYDAVRLFVDRAMSTTPGFAVTGENAPAVAQICQRLDGIPLAIELAAARVNVLAVAQIAARLDDRFRLLTSGSRTALLRQQTLRGAMDWSYGLLEEREKTFLRRLSVFAGGFTLDAAEKICAGKEVDKGDILDLLTSLVDKSLVGFSGQDGQERYRLLETIRQYARDRLLESGETEEVRRRHRDWYMVLAEQAAPELHGPRQQLWLGRLEAEHDNLRAALEWSEAEKDGAEAGLRLAGAVQRFWFMHGHWSEGRRWLEGALERSGEAPPSALPKALVGATHLAWRRGDYGLAATLGEKGLDLCRKLGDKVGTALFLRHLGQIAIEQAHYDRATALLEESLKSTNELGIKWSSGIALAQLGLGARDQGDYRKATALYTESLTLFRELGDKFLIAYALRHLGLVLLRQGDYRRAGASFLESLILCREVGDRWVSQECLEGLAQLTSAKGHYEHAARLFGAAEASREILGYRFHPPDQACHAASVVCTHAALGDADFATACAEGRTMTLEQATEYALLQEAM